MNDSLDERPYAEIHVPINKAIYSNWKTIAKKWKASFEGEHNVFFAEVNTTINTDESENNIHTLKQLQRADWSITADTTYFTYITKKINFNPINVKIRKKSLKSYFLGAFEFNIKKIPTKHYNYIIKTNNEKACRLLLEIPLLKKLLKRNRVVKFVIKPKMRQVKIEFEKVFQEVEDIEKLISLLKDIDLIIKS